MHAAIFTLPDHVNVNANAGIKQKDGSYQTTCTLCVSICLFVSICFIEISATVFTY